MKNDARFRTLLFVIALVSCMLAVAFQGTAHSPAPVSIRVAALQTTATSPAPTPTAAPPAGNKTDPSAILTAWKTSPHSKTYDLGKGPNTYCSRCHSPRNWDLAAKVDAPPNCVSCKFAFDKEVRKAKSNVLIAEADWKNIGCDVCHRAENGVTDAKIAIWNNGTGKYDAVATTTDLCEKCHTDSIAGTRHKIAIGGGAHSNQIGMPGKRPRLCTDCHDPHSTKATCESCHKDARSPSKPINGHDAVHAKIACDACHDASGLKLGPVAESGQWSALLASTSPAGGPPTLKPITSHSLQRTVDCTRCHFDNNANKLRSFVTPTATRAPATPGTPAAGATPTIAK